MKLGRRVTPINTPADPEPSTPIMRSMPRPKDFYHGYQRVICVVINDLQHQIKHLLTTKKIQLKNKVTNVNNNHCRSQVQCSENGQKSKYSTILLH